MRVLSVDDSAMVRKIIRGAVEVLDGDLLEASDGIEALELLEKQYKYIDLILLDWNMPRLNGMEVLKKLKADRRFRSIPVMMVTTESERQNIVSAIQQGAIHYLIKPFTIEELIKRIMECLGKGGYKND
ncbi:MAG: response regulator [Clostridiales bacterium]|nr:response regulator [Clostridiales bacterium]